MRNSFISYLLLHIQALNGSCFLNGEGYTISVWWFFLKSLLVIKVHILWKCFLLNLFKYFTMCLILITFIIFFQKLVVVCCSKLFSRIIIISFILPCWRLQMFQSDLNLVCIAKVIIVFLYSHIGITWVQLLQTWSWHHFLCGVDSFHFHLYFWLGVHVYFILKLNNFIIFTFNDNNEVLIIIITLN